MLNVLVVGLGGFLGAIARYGLSGVVQRVAGGSFPAGTLAVNILGCFLIGGLMCFVGQREFFSPETRLFLVMGFLGSFTTLSAVGYQTFEFLRAGDILMAVVNGAGNLLLGVMAVWLGWIGVKALGI